MKGHRSCMSLTQSSFNETHWRWYGFSSLVVNESKSKGSKVIEFPVGRSNLRCRPVLNKKAVRRGYIKVFVRKYDIRAVAVECPLVADLRYNIPGCERKHQKYFMYFQTRLMCCQGFLPFLLCSLCEMTPGSTYTDDWGAM